MSEHNGRSSQGSNATRPSFFIVGAPKSATTAMYTYLRQHPEVYMPEVKELHYFGTDLRFLPPGRNFKSTPRSSNERSRYLSFFSKAKDSDVVGEASVWYLYSKKAAEEIKMFAPSAKIIIMLRNPVDLLYAMHSQFLWEGNEDIEDFGKALAAEPARKAGRLLPKTMHFRQGLYYRETVQFCEQVQRYFDAFGRENVLVLIYERFSRDPGAAYARVLDFLGVSRSFVPEFQRVNSNKRVHSRLLLDLLANPNNLIKTGAKLLPRRWRSFLLGYLRKINTYHTPRPPLNPFLKVRLTSEFAPQVDRLQRALELDLSFWWGE